MSIGKREDPIAAFNFTISLMEASSGAGKAVTTIAVNSLTDDIDAGFNECSGLEMSLEVEEYQEGGVNHLVHKFPTRLTWGRLVLKKGLLASQALWEWMYGFAEGDVVRKDGLISLLDGEGKVHTVWQFQRGLPVKWSGPSLNAQQSAVAFESIEIEHEGLRLMSGASGLASAVASAAAGVSSLFGDN